MLPAVGRQKSRTELLCIYRIGDSIPGLVNGRPVTVTGYYSTGSKKTKDFYCNWNTYRYKLINGTKDMTICPDDREEVVRYLLSVSADARDTYEFSKREYLASIREKSEGR